MDGIVSHPARGVFSLFEQKSGARLDGIRLSVESDRAEYSPHGYLFFFFDAHRAALEISGQKDPLLLRNTRKSTFEEVDRSFEPDSFEKTW
ncbi:MAG: hypothetical protein IPJ40_00700 [Saprospirales bacterium]|nr:hypothetical protein [Saprospirales bacterium]